MQRIEIKNFGPIKDVSLDVRDFILLIGPQASGKSTIAKTIFFFKSLSDDLVKYFINAFEKNDFSKPSGAFAKEVRKKFLEYFGPSMHLKDISLKYYYTDDIWVSVSVTLESNHNYISPSFSLSLQDFIRNVANESKKFLDAVSRRNLSFLTSKDLLKIESDKREYRSYIKNQCVAFFKEDRELIFIPAGRSLLATLADQLQYIDPKRLDFLMRGFVDKINLLRPLFNTSLDEMIKARKVLTESEINFGKINLAEKIINKILKGKYKNASDGEKIYYDKDKYVKLNLSSSGQQESLWILLLLFIIILEQQNVFIVIEEPEAHLFPEAQKEIAALIALMSNTKQSQVIITTHSPYILASFNNLILAHNVGKKHSDEVAKKIDKRLWINRDKVFAALVQSGTLTDIVDEELNIVQQERIDSVSTSINDEFDYLSQFE